jgi:hypothetical protein
MSSRKFSAAAAVGRHQASSVASNPGSWGCSREIAEAIDSRTAFCRWSSRAST